MTRCKCTAKALLHWTMLKEQERRASMKHDFPTDRAAKRQALLAAVDSVRNILTANADEAEAQRTLPQASVTALRESGHLALKTPAVLGGAEADPMTQFDVLEAVAYIDSSAGWCLGIG